MLHSRCRSPWMDPNYYGLCVLGSYLPPSTRDPIHHTDPDDLDVHEITSLVIHRDAGILTPDVGSFILKHAFDIGSSSEFSFVARDHISNINASLTIQILLDLARLIPKSPIIDDELDDERFYIIMSVKCTSSVLSCFTEIVSSFCFPELKDKTPYWHSTLMFCRIVVLRRPPFDGLRHHRRRKVDHGRRHATSPQCVG